MSESPSIKDRLAIATTAYQFGLASEASAIIAALIRETEQHKFNDELSKTLAGERAKGTFVGESSGAVVGALSKIPPDRVFLIDVEDELRKARSKFPSSAAAMVALTEEVGELAKALLSEAGTDIYKEAVQVAAMAARIALEGDPTLDSYRREHAPGMGVAIGNRPSDWGTKRP